MEAEHSITATGPYGYNITDNKLPNRVAGGFNPPAPTTPCMRVRTGRFTKITGPKPGNEFSPTVL